MKRRISALILLTALLVSILPIASSAVNPDAEDESRYCRTKLTELAGTNEKYTEYVTAYDRIRAAAEAYPARVTLTDLGYSVEEDLTDRETAVDLSDLNVYDADFEAIMEAYRNDYPEYFWMSTSTFSVVTHGDTNDEIPDKHEAVVLKFLFSGEKLPDAKARFDEAVTDFLNRVTATDDYGIALQLHDLLAENIWYTEYADAHDAYGALVDGYAVCEGYTRAYQYLLTKKGIECLVESGTSRDEGHVWNKVKINGSWTNVDVTWDDTELFLFHEYFGSPDAIFYRDHTPDAYPFTLPACTETSLHRFPVSYTSQTLTVEAIAAQLMAAKNEGERATGCSFEYVGSESLLPWLTANSEAIGQQLDICGEELHASFGASFGEERVSGEGSDEYYFGIYNGDLRIDDMSVFVGSDLSVHFTATCDEGSVLQILRNGKYQTLSGTKVEDGVYEYVYPGITPQCIGDPFTAILTVNGVDVCRLQAQTLSSYFETLVTNTAAQNGLTEDQQSALRTFIADLFNFATEAQNYTHYRTAEPINAPDWVDTYETKTPALPEESDLSVQRFREESDTKFTAAGLRLGNALNLSYKFKVADPAGMYLFLYRGNDLFDVAPISSLTPNNDGTYAYFTPDLPAYDCAAPYKAVLCHGETEVIACTYSIDSYIYSGVSSPSLTAILTALSAYGNSGYTFAVMGSG